MLIQLLFPTYSHLPSCLHFIYKKKQTFYFFPTMLSYIFLMHALADHVHLNMEGRMNTIAPQGSCFSFDGSGAHPQTLSGNSEWVSPSPWPPPAPPTEGTTQPETMRGRDQGCGGGGGKEIRGAKSTARTRKQAAGSSRPRFAFQTRSSNDVLDDGYRWRKYGQKAVKNSMHPRSYYRCTHHSCNVKKQVQRLAEDTSIVVTTYEGVHNHPCEKLMEALAPLLKQVQCLAPVLGLFS